MNIFRTLKNKWRFLQQRNPLYSYNKAKLYFKKPIPKVYFGKIFTIGSGNYKYSWLPIYIESFDVGCKDKSIHPEDKIVVYETPPQVLIYLFKKWQIVIRWYPRIISEDYDLYWETLLNFVYYDMNIKEAIENNVHITYKWIEKDDKEIPVEDRRIDAYTENILTRFGKDEYLKLKGVNS